MLVMTEQTPPPPPPQPQFNPSNRFRPYPHRGRGRWNPHNNKRARVVGPKGAELSRYRDQQYKAS